MGDKASLGKFLVIEYADYGGPYHGSAERGQYDSLDEARAAVQRLSSGLSLHPPGSNASLSIYDDQGRRIN